MLSATSITRRLQTTLIVSAGMIATLTLASFFTTIGFEWHAEWTGKGRVIPTGLPPRVQLYIDRGVVAVRFRDPAAGEKHWRFWGHGELSFISNSRAVGSLIGNCVPTYSVLTFSRQTERRVFVPCIFLLVIVTAAILASRRLRRRADRPCNQCGYELSTLSCLRCPECGALCKDGST